MTRYAKKGDPLRGIIPFEQRLAELNKQEQKKTDRDAAKMREESLAMIRNVKTKVASALQRVTEFKFNKYSAREIAGLIEQVTRIEKMLTEEAIASNVGATQQTPKIQLPPAVLEEMAKVALRHILSEQGNVEDADFTAIPAPKDEEAKTVDAVVVEPSKDKE